MQASTHAFSVGSFDCWTLVDSAFQPSSDYLYTNAPPLELTEALNACGCKALGIEVHVNNLLVRTPDGIVLIDSGQGVYSSPAGHVVPNMEAVGVSPSEIDAVVITHGHTDHIGGLLTENFELVYPNARVIMSEAEYGFFTSVSVLDAADTVNRRTGWTAIPQDEANITASTLLNPQIVERLETFRGVQHEVLPGVDVHIAPGHTIGHSIVRITSGDDSLVHIGDLTVTPIHMQHPAWLIKADLATQLVEPTRHEILSALADSGETVFSNHFAFPALGTVTRTATGYDWTPA